MLRSSRSFKCLMGHASDASRYDALAQAFSTLESKQEILDLFEDICTPREIDDMASRLEIARLLAEGVSYTQIQEQTGASAATVARVSRTLRMGTGAYRKALRQMGVTSEKIDGVSEQQ